jgi:hypothetical protein
MTEQDDPDREPQSPVEELDAADSERLRALVRGAMRREQAPEVDVLRGVQRKIRQRSGGKFYSDGWSTAKHPPISTYLLTSLMMLAIIIFVYVLLTPLVGEPVDVDNQPAPVRVVPPRPVSPDQPR